MGQGVPARALGEADWAPCHDQGRPGCRAPEERPAGQPGEQGWSRGPEVLLRVPGAGPEDQMVLFTRGALAARGREPGKACSWPSSPCFSLMLFFAGKSILQIQLGPGPEQLGAEQLVLWQMRTQCLFLPPLGPFWAQSGEAGQEGASRAETQRAQGESLPPAPCPTQATPRTTVPSSGPGPGAFTDPGNGHPLTVPMALSPRSRAEAGGQPPLGSSKDHGRGSPDGGEARWPGLQMGGQSDLGPHSCARFCFALQITGPPAGCALTPLLSRPLLGWSP